MITLRLLVALALLVPAAAALSDPTLGWGTAEITIGQGCHVDALCFPEEFAWVDAVACLPQDSTALVEAQRIPDDEAPIVLTLVPEPTGEAACPYRAATHVEFWMALTDSPLDCLRASVVSFSGVLRTRTQCFSDL